MPFFELLNNLGDRVGTDNAKYFMADDLVNFVNSRILKSKIKLEDFDKLPSWIIIGNKEVKISSTEIRKQREKFRGKN